MPEIKLNNLVKFYSVLLLSTRAMHGYELMKEIGKKTGRKVSAGQIYPFLDLLKRKGFLKFEKKGARDRQAYSLSSSGKKLVRKMLFRFGELIDIAIMPRLSTCAHCGCKIFSGGHAEKFGKKNLVFCCCHCAKSYRRSA